MCQNPDGSYTIPVAGEEFLVPTDAGTLGIIHCTMYHCDTSRIVDLIVQAYRDLNQLWLHFRKEMYAKYNEETCTESQYKTAMNYLVACAVHNDTLADMVDLVDRMEQEAW